jgi:hypothetical protein
MKNNINEEINRTLFLFGYKPGKVISEQVHPELDEVRGAKPKYTDDEIRQIASNYKTVPEFKKENPKLFNIVHNRKMFDDLFPDRKKHKKLTDDEVRIEASKHKTVKDFQKKSPTIFSTARNRKMLDDLFPDRQIGQGRTPKYSEDYIRREASKYKTDKDFMDKNYQVYQIAYKRKMIDDLYPDRKKNTFYTDDDIRIEASKYTSVPEFSKKSPKIFRAANSRKMLDDLFPDRQIGRGRPKLIRKPEEIEYEPTGGISHYWSSSPTSSLNVKPNYDYKYEN